MTYLPQISFCDYISVTQTHLEKHKPLYDGYVTHFDKNGKPERLTLKTFTQEGSHSTKIQVRSDGRTVSVKGNFGRYNRPDNLFGHTLDETKIIINKFLQSINLPPFTDGEITLEEYRNKKGETAYKKTTTGATIARIDYTINYITGSPKNAKDYIYACSRTNINRQNITDYGDSVYYGIGSKLKLSKIYLKHKEIEHQTKKSKLPESTYTQQIRQYCETNGIVRFETQFRNYLQRYSLNFWQNATHKNLIKHHQEDLKIMAKPSKQLDIDELPNSIVGTYLMYTQGINLQTRLSRNTFYKHRAELLKYGIDIKNNHNIKPIPIKQKVIELREITKIPDWYYTPKEHI